jgi:hypothetical protein
MRPLSPAAPEPDHFSKAKIANALLVAIFLVAAASIIGRSVLVFHGYITPDSSFYLALAQNLIDGNGYRLLAYPYSFTSKPDVFFSVWPVGYPTLIFLVAKLSGLSVFLASKVTNIVCLGISLMFLRLMFPDRAHVIALVFLTPSISDIFTYTLSETVFLTAMIAFAYYLFRYTVRGGTPLLSGVVISCIALFCARYIGAFALGVLAITAVSQELAGRSTRLAGLALAAAVFVAFISLYLSFNFLQTGYITGMPRISAPESFATILAEFLKAGAGELVPLFPAMLFPLTFSGWLATAVLQVLVGLGVLRISGVRWRATQSLPAAAIFRAAHFRQILGRQEFHLFMTAVVYLASIVAIRFARALDPLDYWRLVAPGFVLVEIAALSAAMAWLPKAWEGALKRATAAIFGFAMALNAVAIPIGGYYLWGRLTYPAASASVKALYSNLEPGSTVIFPNWNMNYLRTDLRGAWPRDWRLQSLGDLVGEIKAAGRTDIYLQVQQSPLGDCRLAGIHPSYCEAVRRYPGASFLRLN